MAAMIPSPKSPLGLLLVGGALWFMATRSRATVTSSGQVVRTPTTAYSSPVKAAELLASRVLALTKGLTKQSQAVQAEEAAREAGRNAVRAGDADYGAGAWKYYANNVEEARRAMGEGGWSAPTTTAVAAIDRGTVGGETDTVPAAPVYDASTDADRWALSALAGLP